MRLVLLGPPGAGKGTQALRIAAEYDIPHIATGDIFRDNVKGETELGLQARSYMDRGDLVPDEVVNDMVAERLDRPDCGDGFLLDGYPRTLTQAASLETVLDERDAALDAVLRFAVPESELLKRLKARAETDDRSDDSEPVIRNRLEVYHRQTAPLESFYAERGLLREVDAFGSVEEVTERALKALRSA